MTLGAGETLAHVAVSQVAPASVWFGHAGRCFRGACNGESVGVQAGLVFSDELLYLPDFGSGVAVLAFMVDATESRAGHGSVSPDVGKNYFQYSLYSNFTQKCLMVI